MKAFLCTFLALQLISIVHTANAQVKPFRKQVGGWNRLLFAKKQRLKKKSAFGKLLAKAGALVKGALGLDAVDKLKEQKIRLVAAMNVIDRNLLLLRTDTRSMLRDAMNKLETELETSFLDFQVQLSQKAQEVQKHAYDFARSYQPS